MQSPVYPQDSHQRARVHERTDWINTRMNCDFASGFVNLQIVPSRQRPGAEVQSATPARGRQSSGVNACTG